MKFKPLFAIMGLTTTLAFSLTVTSAEAQGRRGGRNGGQGNNQTGQAGNPGGPVAGAQGTLSPMQLQMIMGGFGNIVDPARSAKFMLVYRVDVQNALNLDLKQKVALDALKTVQTQDQQKMAQDMRTLMQSTHRQAQTTTPEEQQQNLQDLTARAQGITQGYQDDLDKRADDILTPKQRKRLSEIDLRWRGPLSLVDPKVAEQASLGTDDKQKAQDAYKQFTDARQKLMDAMMPTGMRTRNGSGTTTTTSAAVPSAAATNGVSPDAGSTTQSAVPMTTADRLAAQKKAQSDFDKSCIAMAAKLVANLTPTAASTWQDMLGTPFTFREVNP